MDEHSPIVPHNVYGMTKAAGWWVCQHYRRHFQLHTNVGILFNHESPLRKAQFLTRKISLGIAAIQKGESSQLELASLDNLVDWTDARDFVNAFWLMLQQDNPDDYVIASSETRSVRDWVVRAFELAGLDWKKHVKSPSLDSSKPSPMARIGDIKKIQQAIQWTPKISFDDMISNILRADGVRLSERIRA